MLLIQACVNLTDLKEQRFCGLSVHCKVVGDQAFLHVNDKCVYVMLTLRMQCKTKLYIHVNKSRIYVP